MSTNAHEISFLLHDGHRFDFDKELRPEKPGHFNGGAGRWIVKIDVLVAYFSEFGQTGEIQEVASSGLENLKDFVAHSVGLPFTDSDAHDLVQPGVLR